MNKMKKLIPLGAYLLPLMALAQGVNDAITTVENILTRIIPLLMIIATIVFLWGIIRYITAAGDEEKIAEGRRLIIYGLIGLFVMVSVWGLVEVIANTFGVTGRGIPSGPGNW